MTKFGRFWSIGFHWRKIISPETNKIKWFILMIQIKENISSIEYHNQFLQLQKFINFKIIDIIFNFFCPLKLKFDNDLKRKKWKLFYSIIRQLNDLS